MSLRAIFSALPIRRFAYLLPKQPQQLNTKVDFERFLNSKFRDLGGFKKTGSVQPDPIGTLQVQYVQFLRFLIGHDPVSRKHLPILEFVYLKPPPNFNPQMEIVGCFVRHQDRSLFLRQRSDDSEGDTWGVPGGKVAKSETALAGCVREVQEETGLVLKKTSQFMREVYIRLPEKDFVYKIFEANLEDLPESVTIDPNEHVDFSWMTLPEALSHSLIRGEDECILLTYWNRLTR